jgi:hypothetical protein
MSFVIKRYDPAASKHHTIHFYSGLTMSSPTWSSDMAAAVRYETRAAAEAEIRQFTLRFPGVKVTVIETK